MVDVLIRAVEDGWYECAQEGGGCKCNGETRFDGRLYGYEIRVVAESIAGETITSLVFVWDGKSP